MYNFSKNGSLNTYGDHLFWFWKFFLCRKLVDQTHLRWLHLFGKLLKWHLLKYDQLMLKWYKLHKSGIGLVILSHASYKIGDNFQQHKTGTLKKSCYHDEQYICCYDTCLFEISKNIYFFFVYCISFFSKVLFKIWRKLVWLGGLYIIPTVIDVVWAIEFERKCFRLHLEKNLSPRN